MRQQTFATSGRRQFALCLERSASGGHLISFRLRVNFAASPPVSAVPLSPVPPAGPPSSQASERDHSHRRISPLAICRPATYRYLNLPSCHSGRRLSRPPLCCCCSTPTTQYLPSYRVDCSGLPPHINLILRSTDQPQIQMLGLPLRDGSCRIRQIWCRVTR